MHEKNCKRITVWFHLYVLWKQAKLINILHPRACGSQLPPRWPSRIPGSWSSHPWVVPPIVYQSGSVWLRANGSDEGMSLPRLGYLSLSLFSFALGDSQLQCCEQPYGDAYVWWEIDVSCQLSCEDPPAQGKPSDDYSQQLDCNPIWDPDPEPLYYAEFLTLRNCVRWCL